MPSTKSANITTGKPDVPTATVTEITSIGPSDISTTIESMSQPKESALEPSKTEPKVSEDKNANVPPPADQNNIELVDKEETEEEQSPVSGGLLVPHKLDIIVEGAELSSSSSVSPRTEVSVADDSSAANNITTLKAVDSEDRTDQIATDLAVTTSKAKVFMCKSDTTSLTSGVESGQSQIDRRRVSLKC